ncbi:hypothetical protein I3843_11G175200 [Carya illinoinensis]|nr:hypothetical protein I3843_11G175200 [Carya illinoinensis]
MDVYSCIFLGANFLLFLSGVSSAADTNTQSQSIIEGSTLISREGGFELGFFSLGSSTNRYLGIWYRNIPVKTVVWVANRRNPIEDSSGVLMINSTGNLVLLSQNTSVVWLANSTKEASSPILQLLDSGNLVLRDREEGNSENYLWQSFDHPSDTLTGLDRRLSTWKNWDDPSPGDLTWGIELTNNPEAVMWKGSEKYFRSGPWNGPRYSGVPELRYNPVFEFNFVNNENEVYYIYHLINKSIISKIIMNQTNYSCERYIWIDATSTWSLYSSVPRDNCDDYNLCGAYGNCIIGESPVCQCLKGFQSKSQETWNPKDWSQGCVRITQLSCQDKDKHGFIKFVGLKLPETTNSWVNESMNLEECRTKCLNNCSCMAYTNSNIRGGGSDCALWYGDLIDIRQVSLGGQNLYVRMPASELEAKDEHKTKVIVISVLVPTIVYAMLFMACFLFKRRTKFRGNVTFFNLQSVEGRKEDLELPLFNLMTITKLTTFQAITSLEKGTLEDGQEIAVKRLSESSGQGLNEFKTEVILIAKLQHRNLVRLLGCCIQGEEKLLIYEYMTNKSLDTFIFDQARGKVLDWSKRFHIICGVARGLLYLHEDSRLRIIYRDLKASNVLLDSEMNPKISDFGIARTFRGDQTQGKTNRVIGTYGYMAPEYAINGFFSVKSDVFGFGILLMEMLSGKKNRAYYHPGESLNFIGHAWNLWREGRPLELVDTCLRDSCSLSEMLRCIQISLAGMSSVVMMLSGEPKEPGFFARKNPPDADSSSSKHQSSTNELTLTLLEAR